MLTAATCALAAWGANRARCWKSYDSEFDGLGHCRRSFEVYGNGTVAVLRHSSRYYYKRQSGVHHIVALCASVYSRLSRLAGPEQVCWRGSPGLLPHAGVGYSTVEYHGGMGEGGHWGGGIGGRGGPQGEDRGGAVPTPTYP